MIKWAGHDGEAKCGRDEVWWEEKESQQTNHRGTETQRRHGRV
jgi:hypothetical protein